MVSIKTGDGVILVGAAKYQLPPSVLIEESLAKGEGQLAANGALVVNTGKYTGRSPNDRYLVDDRAVHPHIHWGNVNRPLSEDVFEKILAVFRNHLKEKTVYIFDGMAGADPRYAAPVRAVTERASQNLFAHQMFIRPPSDAEWVAAEAPAPGITILVCPSLQLNSQEFGLNSEVAIVIHLSRRIVLIAGSSYSGEIKKSVFSTLNYYFPARDVLPMHCAVNVGDDEKDVAIFFGLSGTGKTSLSADPARRLVGDDEHGWGPDGIFNFEGGFYAKCIRLNQQEEPEIWNAIRFGSLIENVVVDEKTRRIDFDDERYTENARATYPLSHISRTVASGMAAHPRIIFFLTADAFGVLPPISRLSVEQAQYHFISGYTSKLAQTERGVTGTQATFSTCFGAPFMPRPSGVYSTLLAQKMRAHHTQVYLVNTGWVGGRYGIGKRIQIPYTRAMIRAALSGKLDRVVWKEHPIFGVSYPNVCTGVPSELLNPAEAWQDKKAYEDQARMLARSFVENFRQFPGAEALARYGPSV